jgi:hypothetical protein
MLALAAYSPYRFTDLGHLICWWTSSPYSHVEVVIDTDLVLTSPKRCYSSSIRDGGVRGKTIDLNKPHWKVLPITWASEEKALAVFNKYKGRRYGWGDLVGQHVLRLPVNDSGLLCSELSALMFGLPESVALGMSPGHLVDYVESRNDF